MSTEHARRNSSKASKSSVVSPPSPGEIPEIESPLLVTHCRKWGDSFVILLPREVREPLGLVHGDLIGIRKVGRRFTLLKLEAGVVMPLSLEEARRAAARVGARNV